MEKLCSHLRQVPDPRIPKQFLFYCDLLQRNVSDDNYLLNAQEFKNNFPERFLVPNGECPWIREKEGVSLCPLREKYKQSNN